jgi:hypothetical protein
MKRILVTLCIALFCSELFGQDLIINPSTGLISIIDSMDLKGKTLEQVKTAIANWGHSLLDMDNLKDVFKLDNSRQTETVGINLPVGTILTQDRGNSTFVTKGTLTYSKTRTSGLNRLAPTAAFGGVKFSFIYTVTSSRIIVEFTNMEYSHDMVHYGKFESDKAPQNSYGASVFFGTSKREWNRLRLEYFNNLKILAGYLKQYATPLLGQ